jgi:hypothetical protein
MIALAVVMLVIVRRVVRLSHGWSSLGYAY